MSNTEELQLELVGKLVQAARQFADGQTQGKIISAGEVLTTEQYTEVMQFTQHQFQMIAQDVQFRLNSEGVSASVSFRKPGGFVVTFSIIPNQR